MWRMLQQDEADDHVVVVEKFYRPAEVQQLLGNSAKAKSKPDWTPTTTFEQLVHLMTDTDLARYE